MIELIEKPRQWLNEMATEHHYMHRPIHQKSVPFGWAVSINGEETGRSACRLYNFRHDPLHKAWW